MSMAPLSNLANIGTLFWFMITKQLHEHKRDLFIVNNNVNTAGKTANVIESTEGFDRKCSFITKSYTAINECMVQCWLSLFF